MTDLKQQAQRIATAWWGPGGINAAAKVLDEVLEEARGEPVAWMYIRSDGWTETPLYALPTPPLAQKGQADD